MNCLAVPSLQAKHSTLCALGRAWTPFDQTEAGCTCPQGPVYYVVVRDGEHAHKEVVGRDRHHAELALLRLEDSVEEGDYRPRPNVGFSDWADRWLDSLERKPSTVGSYRSTIVHAKEAFRGTRVALARRTSAASTWFLESKAAPRRLGRSTCAS